LSPANIRYTHMPGLGGFRRPRPDSPNTGWRNENFRGYADYMMTPEFQQNLQHLIDLAAEDRPAIMCAEAVPWRCHRSLVADALLVRGIDVREIANPSQARPHKLHSWAKVNGTELTYPAEI
jgi:uncharacterized protein (DUF488 family)